MFTIMIRIPQKVIEVSKSCERSAVQVKSPVYPLIHSAQATQVNMFFVDVSEQAKTYRSLFQSHKTNFCYTY